MVELKQPSDLTGQFVGETAQKTAALIDNCRGKAYLPSAPVTLSLKDTYLDISF